MAGAGRAFDVEALRRRLDARCPGIAVEVVAETGSTNSDLLQRVRDAGAERGLRASSHDDDTNDTGGIARVRRSVESRAYSARGVAPAPPFGACLLVAEQQTAGRGRHGRRWASRRGASLTFSLALPLDRADWSGLSLAVGVAIADALDPAPAAAVALVPDPAPDPAPDVAREAAGPDRRDAVASTRPSIGLKWPNDLWLVERRGNGRKLGGVLIETIAHGPGRVAVIGVGLNVRAPTAGDAFAPDAASLDEIVPFASAASTLEAVAAPLLDALQAFEAAGFAAFEARYAARDALAGLAVTTTEPGAVVGVADGIGAHGALLVRTADGTRHAVSSGAVSVRLRAWESAP